MLAVATGLDLTDDNDSPTKKIKKPKVECAPTLWPTAPSLRPDPVRLAEACLEGDAEAIAIRDAYRFHTSKATRLVVVAADDPMFSRVTIFVGGAEGSSCQARLIPKVTESRQTIKAQLNDAMAKYQNCAEEGVQGLWEAIHLFARHCAAAYKQEYLRTAGLQGDLTNDFTLHAMEKAQGGMFSGVKVEDGIEVEVPFDHWIETTFRNYANTELSDLTDHRKRFLEIATGDDAAKPREEVANVSSNVSAQKHQLREAQKLRLGTASDQRQSWWTDERLRELPKADQEYAAFLMQGLNQKQAAVRMEESVVTARKREQRIRAALDTGTDSPQAVSVDADPHRDATEGTCTPLALSTGTVADVCQ